MTVRPALAAASGTGACKPDFACHVDSFYTMKDIERSKSETQKSSYVRVGWEVVVSEVVVSG